MNIVPAFSGIGECPVLSRQIIQLGGTYDQSEPLITPIVDMKRTFFTATIMNNTDKKVRTISSFMMDIGERKYFDGIGSLYLECDGNNFEVNGGSSDLRTCTVEIVEYDVDYISTDYETVGSARSITIAQVQNPEKTIFLHRGFDNSNSVDDFGVNEPVSFVNFINIPPYTKLLIGANWTSTGTITWKAKSDVEVEVTPDPNYSKIYKCRVIEYK